MPRVQVAGSGFLEMADAAVATRRKKSDPAIFGVCRRRPPCTGAGPPGPAGGGRESDPADLSGAGDGEAAICTGDGRPGGCRPGRRQSDPADPSGAGDDAAAICTGDGRPSSCRPGGRESDPADPSGAGAEQELPSAEEMADDAQKFDGENALAKVKPDGAQDYRTRVEGAELPDDVRKAALGEVDKLWNELVTRAPTPAKSGSGSTRFSTCRGAPRPRTGSTFRGHAKLKRHCGG